MGFINSERYDLTDASHRNYEDRRHKNQSTFWNETNVIYIGK